MAPGAPQPSFSSWELYQKQIIQAVKTIYPHLSSENRDLLLEEIKRNFPADFVGDTRAVLAAVNRLADPLISERRRHHWEEHKASILPKIREAIPAAAREFEIHYTTQLLNQVFDRFNPETWPSGDVIPEKLKAIVDEVVPTAVAQLTTGDGELREEELVRLYRAGYGKCRTILLERYATKLHDLTPRIIHKKDLCPSVEDATQFAKDVAQDVSLKLLEELDSYNFESKFETWVGTIIENEARTRARKLFGRSKHGKREFLSFEEWRHQPIDPVIHDREHREILRKALQKHRAGGAHNAKSADAIELRYYEDLDTPEVAERLRTTRSYVYRLFSDDYPEIRRILIKDFGLTGADL